MKLTNQKTKEVLEFKTFPNVVNYIEHLSESYMEWIDFRNKEFHYKTANGMEFVLSENIPEIEFMKFIERIEALEVDEEEDY